MSEWIDECPLCGGRRLEEHSVPHANLYSEKLAELLDEEESKLLDQYSNWRCMECTLVFKRLWFSSAALSALFKGAVASHPRGWDTMLGRFSADGFRLVLGQWSNAIRIGSTPGIRRGERELLSILESIVEPDGFDLAATAVAVSKGDVGRLGADAPAIMASIGKPAPFKRFSGFGSSEIWDYLQQSIGPIGNYAELGCPLWGLLRQAAGVKVRSTFLKREEPNYWGKACTSNGVHCLELLLENPDITSAAWDAPERYDVIGLFQYLDHLREPRTFLENLFGKANSAAIILDDMDHPPAIQHFTGWSDECMAWVSKRFNKRLFQNFDAIRPSGNRLHLFTREV
jgi:hypothetical protein